MIGGLLFVVVIIILAVVVANQMGWTLPYQAGGPSGPTAGDNCPDTGTTSLKLQVYNPANTSDVENYDQTIVCMGSDGSATTITDTTTPTASSVNCGYNYVCKAVSSSNAGGDHGYLTGIRSGPASASLSGGILSFRADAPNVNIDLDSTQHGRLEARVYNNDEASFVYSEYNGQTKGVWTATGYNFSNSSTNSSDGGLLYVGSGGKLDLRMDIRVQTNQDEQLEDFGWYLLLDAPSTKWDVPSITIDGAKRTSNCAALNSDEAKKYSGEEYCYKITGIPVTNNDGASIGMVFNALNGVNPTTTDSINVTIVGIGSYQSTTDSTDVLIGAVKDDSSQTVVLNQEEWKIGVG